MSSLGTTLRIPIRHYYVSHSEEGHPWTVHSGLGLDPWYAYMPPEDIVAVHHDGASKLLGRLSDIELVLESVERIDSDYWYRVVDQGENDIHKDLISALWARGQPFLVVVWVRDANYNGSAYAARYRQWHEGPWEWVPGTGTVIVSGLDIPTGPYRGTPTTDIAHVLAHEIGHQLGLTHTWDSDAGDMLGPFESDIPPVNSLEEDRNVMGYWMYKDFIDTNNVPRHGLETSEFLMTDSQARRARLTCFQRWSPMRSERRFSHLKSYEGEYNGMTTQELLDLGFIDATPLPDVLAPLHAAWVGI